MHFDKKNFFELNIFKLKKTRILPISRENIQEGHHDKERVGLKYTDWRSRGEVDTEE